MLNKLISVVLEVVVKNISPQLREYIVSLVASLEAKAKETKNPWDDVIVKLIKILLKINGKNSD